MCFPRVYKAGVKDCVLLDLSNKQIFISRYVSYHELVLPYKERSNRPSWSYHSGPTTQEEVTTAVDNSQFASDQDCPSKSANFAPAPTVQLRKP